MKKIVFILLICLLSSCTISKNLETERRNWNFKNWKQEYKDRAFYLCVLNGFENNKLEKDLIKSDRSFYSPLGMAIFDESLYPIINQEVNKIRLDSINLSGTYPEDLKVLYEKREVLGHCLNFYKSKELNDLAKKEKKKWNRIPNILERIQEKTPTY